jgi:tRNA-2-methylthio-N6-dimethylallyladenosine synthase
MLQKMKRNYTRESYLRGINELRRAVPNIAISTDIIVGFPGETEEDFQATLSLVKEVGFDSAYCFKYSPRPGTASAEWEDTVSDEEKERRVNELLALTDNQGAKNAQALIGSTHDVLIEQDKGEGLVRGKTGGAWRVRLTDPSLKLGDMVRVKITGTHSRELHGTLCHCERSEAICLCK